MRERVQKILHRIQDLPTLPAVYKRVNEMIRDPHSSANDIASVVSEDQVITAKLLRLVNSAHYGFPEKINTVSRAVSLVGVKALANLILATSVMEIFQEDKVKVGDFDPGEFWKHSLGVATAARAMAKLKKLDNEEEFFVGGLLHDIGKIVWIQHFPEEFQAVLKKAEAKRSSVIECENQLLGINHTRVGRMLAKRWSLPEQYIEAIAWHHDPLKSENHQEFAAFIHVADSLACALRLGESGSYKVPWIREEAWELCGLFTEQLDELLELIMEAYKDSIMVLSFWDEREKERVEDRLAEI